MNKGFTLIETLIYIALFSLLMGSAFIATYQLIDGSGKISAKNTIQNEGNFVVRKLSWALTGVDPSTVSPSSGNSSTLSVTKYDGNKIDVRLSGGKIEMRESDAGNTYLPITTDNISVSNLDFKYESLDGITVTTTIDGINFTITKYFRK
jgi:prepilin-type N-terminal cleavage/methylation domain-containing protein